MKTARRRTPITLLRIVVALFCLTAASANATFHLWRMTELFSNADGSVQYLELATTTSGEQFLAFHDLTSVAKGVTRVYNFPTNLPGDSANKTFLVGTEGFAALKLVTPDYVVPNGFFGVDGGVIDFAGADLWQPPALPVDGKRSLGRSGASSLATPVNFAGETAVIDLSVPALNVQALWWSAPAGGESGWGVNLSHQGEKIFATWFTYDIDSKGLWLVMSDGVKGAGNSWSGALHRTTAPSFNTINSANASSATYQQVGNATFTFTDPDNGTFAYTVNGVTQAKPITRYVYASPVPTCTVGGSAGAKVNYQDIWWRSPAGSESGWGVNLVHQGDTLFATWFTYAADRRAMWLVASDIVKVREGVYAGALFRTTGMAFSATPWRSTIGYEPVGNVTFTFTDANNGVMDYTVDGFVQSKPVTRYVFASPPTVCR